MRTQSREAEKGFYTFLESERIRHYQDIKHIMTSMDIVEKEQQLTNYEIVELRERARRFVYIKEYHE